MGGIEDAATAFAKIEAGADLIELYSALVFKGPGLIRAIKEGLVARLAKDNRTLADCVGAAAANWAAGKMSAADLS